MVKSDVQKGLRQLEGSGSVADFVFLDPPYSLHEEYAKTLATLAQSKLLGEKSVVIAEHQKRFDPGEEFGELRRYRTLVQGDAALSFYRRLVTQSS
ncbi:MAG TPA: RsmD family RNA methyltransferase, partial [Terriglobales bacterium]|nr:RsmD family RNA methyltransferase [Terriglobales bacterium]